jgi:hypothetical protein
MEEKALNLREPRSNRRSLRRARAFDDYSNALRRYYESWIADHASSLSCRRLWPTRRNS